MNILKIFCRVAKKNILFITIATICAGLVAFLNFKIPFVNKAIIDDAIGKKDINTLNFLIIFLLIISVLSYLVQLFETYIFTKISKKFTKSIHKQIIHNLFLKNHNFFTNQTSGEITSKVAETWDLEELFSPQFFSSIYSFFTLAGAIIILFNVNVFVTFISIIGVALSALFIFLSNNFIQKNMPSVLDKKVQVVSKIQEIILGIFEIRSNSASDLFFNNCKKAVDEKCKFSLKFSMGINLFLNTSNVATSLLMISILYFFGVNIITSDFTIGTYFLIVSYVQKIMDPVMQISGIAGQIKPMLVTAKRIEKNFSLSNEDSKNIIPSSLKSINILEIKNLFYSYPNCTKKIISNFNLKARKGEVILIKGKNGSGKTTLLDILCGELKAENGEVLFDKKSENFQDYVSILRQKPYIFDLPMQSNIILNQTYDEKKYLNILNKLCFNDYFDFDIFQNKTLSNNSLSGGQIKLIALARCLYRERPILIFDEAISDLDKNLKKLIVNFVKENKSKYITILVEHTDEFLNIADITLNMEKKLDPVIIA